MDAINPSAPCPYPAGSREKVRYLKARARARMPLFLPEDAGGVLHHSTLCGPRPGEGRRSRREVKLLAKAAWRLQERGASLAAIAHRLEISRSYAQLLIRCCRLTC